MQTNKVARDFAIDDAKRMGIAPEEIGAPATTEEERPEP
jgi:hypothetical protein